MAADWPAANPVRAMQQGPAPTTHEATLSAAHPHLEVTDRISGYALGRPLRY
jgi:hypothetical protein